MALGEEEEKRYLSFELGKKENHVSTLKYTTTHVCEGGIREGGGTTEKLVSTTVYYMGQG